MIGTLDTLITGPELRRLQSTGIALALVVVVSYFTNTDVLGSIPNGAGTMPSWFCVFSLVQYQTLFLQSSIDFAKDATPMANNVVMLTLFSRREESFGTLKASPLIATC